MCREPDTDTLRTPRGEFFHILPIDSWEDWGWPAAKVPADQIRRVHSFFDNYKMIEDELKAALRVPDVN